MNNLKIEAEREAQIILNYFKANNYISAEIKAKKLIKKFPNFQALYNLLGLCLQSQKKFQEAIKYYKIAIQNNPNFFVAINNLGLTYHNMYDLKNAQHYYERAIEINPKFTHAICNLGNIKKELNNFEETIKSRYRDSFSYESFSEGEKARIDIALLLTWRAVAKLKNSVDTNILILDEIFDGSLDAGGTSELGWILRNFDDNTNVFVISHKETLEGKFERTLNVEKVKNYSVIRESVLQLA